MKKVYINPTIEIVKVESHQIMAGSPYNLNNSKQNPAEADSRQGRGFWDDEEDY